MTTAVQLAQMAAPGVSLGFKNRIINGGMTIDQRNAGASVTQTTGYPYTIDRWQIGGSVSSKFTAQQNAGAVTPPTGFVNYIGITSSSAYTVGAAEAFSLRQAIEANNMVDLAWGTAGAVGATLSFWVRSSLTGTLGGALYNYAGNYSLPFVFTVSSANTWEYKTVTIAGSTSGVWATDNSAGLFLYFNLGAGSSMSGTAGAWTSSVVVAPTGATSVVGTSGATFYITGVQLEKGSTATSFDYRPYGTELALCQRYYWKGTVSAGGVFGGSGGSVPIIGWAFPVTMRTSPSWAWVSGGSTSNGNADYAITGGNGYTAYTDSARLLFTQTGTTGTNAQGAATYGALSTFTAEL